MTRYTAATQDERERMLAAVGAQSIEDLFSEIPAGVRLGDPGTQFGDLNGIIFTALQGVEASRLSAEEAADFVIDEATASLKDVIVK